MTPDDWPEVRRIYLDGIASGNATFETDAPDWDEWNRRHLAACRIVAREGSGLAGWAALSPVSVRAVYRGVAEVSVYVDAGHQGRGLGSALLGRLVEESEAEGIWTLQASIFPENVVSIALHRKAGFRIVGTRERIAQRDGVWRDTVLMERRSSK